MISKAKRLFPVNYMEGHILFPLLALIAVLTRIYDINFILGISYSFSSLFLLLIIKLFGLNFAVITAVVAQFAAASVLDYPGFGIIFVLEVVFIGFLTKRKLKVNIVFLDIIFWIFIGLPIFMFVYHNFFSNVDKSVFYLQASKDLTNSILNCVIADTILSYMPFAKWLEGKREEDSTIKFHKFLFHITTITMIVDYQIKPSKLLLFYHIKIGEGKCEPYCKMNE